MDRYEYQPVPVEQLADYLNTSEGHEFTFHPPTLVRNAICELYAIKKNRPLSFIRNVIRAVNKNRSLEASTRDSERQAAIDFLEAGRDMALFVAAYRGSNASGPDDVWRIGNPENDDHFFTDKPESAKKAEQNGYEVTHFVPAAHHGSRPVARAERWNGSDSYREVHIGKFCCVIYDPRGETADQLVAIINGETP